MQHFFRDHIQNKSLDKNFVCDVYRDNCGREDQSGGCICPTGGPVFRYTASEVTMQSSPYLRYWILRDFVYLATSKDNYKLIYFLKLKKSQQEESDEEACVFAPGPMKE
ncbi:hypothetical protein MATL_G00261440 [Megalops atlanticus]|uniref:Uncharacterized protein n=1 Tax=Megalops atlanticus TaxID=7932 RepID=A0A9D3P8Y6_MEGAT|nr:hypothetical protein MATL_G00261440 [Megalops atlanticus]